MKKVIGVALAIMILAAGSVAVNAAVKETDVKNTGKSVVRAANPADAVYTNSGGCSYPDCKNGEAHSAADCPYRGESDYWDCQDNGSTETDGTYHQSRHEGEHGSGTGSHHQSDAGHGHRRGHR